MQFHMLHLKRAARNCKSVEEPEHVVQELHTCGSDSLLTTLLCWTEHQLDICTKTCSWKSSATLRITAHKTPVEALATISIALVRLKTSSAEKHIRVPARGT